MEALAAPQEDTHNETLAAFFGALDDIVANTPDAELTSPDTEIANKVMGLFDTASTFYDADMARNMELVNNLASRLGAMACSGHSHMENILESITTQYELNRGHNDHNHPLDKHADDNDHETPGKAKKGSKKKKKPYDNRMIDKAKKATPKNDVKSYILIIQYTLAISKARGASPTFIPPFVISI
jgi:hypothetical protein